MDEEKEMPLGLAFQMAMNEKAMAHFSAMSEKEKENTIERARNVKSKQEMERLVNEMGKTF